MTTYVQYIPAKAWINAICKRFCKKKKCPSLSNVCISCSRTHVASEKKLQMLIIPADKGSSTETVALYFKRQLNKIFPLSQSHKINFQIH